jgi:hypothetical protein
VVSTLPVPGATISRIALDDKSLFWTSGGGGYLFRHSFADPVTAPKTILAITQFSQGRLSPYPMPSLFRAGDWLIFDDRQFAERSSGWTIRSFNVVTSTDTILVRNQASNVLYSFSTDGEWLAWISGDLTTGTILSSLNLQTGDRREIARSDLLSDGWEEVSVSAGRAAATQIGRDARNVFLFDLKSGESRKLAVDPAGSDISGMTFDGNWITWKTGTNSQGSTVLYNLQTAATEIFPDWGIQPILAGRWLTWAPGYDKPLYAVDLETLDRYLVAETQPGEELTAAAVRGDRIAWGRLHFNLPNRSNVNSAVEWRSLPQ